MNGPRVPERSRRLHTLSTDNLPVTRVQSTGNRVLKSPFDQTRDKQVNQVFTGIKELANLDFRFYTRAKVIHFH